MHVQIDACGHSVTDGRHAWREGWMDEHAAPRSTDSKGLRNVTLETTGDHGGEHGITIVAQRRQPWVTTKC